VTGDNDGSFHDGGFHGFLSSIGEMILNF
jgi:hypothetical protein